MFLCFLYLQINVFNIYEFNSAKREQHEVTPQSNYVLVHSNGTCEWYPLYVWSVTHCLISSTWFPFDEQRCSLIYQSWKYKNDEVQLTSYFGSDAEQAIRVYDWQPNNQWEFLGKSFLCFSLHTLLCVASQESQIGHDMHL